MVEFCVYYGLRGGYSYSNMTNYFKMNNNYTFYGKTGIVMTAIMSNNSNLPGYADFTQEVLRRSADQIQGYIRVMLECSI